MIKLAGRYFDPDTNVITLVGKRYAVLEVFLCSVPWSCDDCCVTMLHPIESLVTHGKSRQHVDFSALPETNYIL